MPITGKNAAAKRNVNRTWAEAPKPGCIRQQEATEAQPPIALHHGSGPAPEVIRGQTTVLGPGWICVSKLGNDFQVKGLHSRKHFSGHREQQRYCVGLSVRGGRRRRRSLHNELRRFYRLAQGGKIRMIDALH